MKLKSTSPQYLRTHKAIIRALCELLKSNSFESITVQHILDETPISRTAFYQHFHDKYEIAEEMQETYLSEQDRLLAELRSAQKLEDYQPIMVAHSAKNMELMQALMKIRTDRVNLRDFYTGYHQDLFASSTSADRDCASSIVFASAMTAYLFATFTTDILHTDMRVKYNETMLPAVLALLNLENDKDAYDYLYRKVNTLHS